MANDDVVEVLDTDSLEEVLHQTAEQTLKLARIEDGVGELKRRVDEVGDALTTGLVELRGLAAQGSAPAGNALSDAAMQALSERLEEVEKRARSAAGRSSIVLVLSLITAGAVGVLVAAALGLAKLGHDAPPPPVIATPPPAPAPVVTPPPAAAPEPSAEPPAAATSKKPEPPAKKKKHR